MKLDVDWIRCTGHGLCAEIAPELVSLDDWGYPIVSDPVDPELESLAERARSACPAMALRLDASRVTT
jgi:ferredoxin